MYLYVALKFIKKMHESVTLKFKITITKGFAGLKSILDTSKCKLQHIKFRTSTHVSLSSFRRLISEKMAQFTDIFEKLSPAVSERNGEDTWEVSL